MTRPVLAALLAALATAAGCRCGAAPGGGGEVAAAPVIPDDRSAAPSPHRLTITCPPRTLIPAEERTAVDPGPWRYDQVKIAAELQDLLCLAAGAGDPLSALERACAERDYRYDPDRNTLALTVVLSLSHTGPVDPAGGPRRAGPDELPAAVLEDPCWAELTPYVDVTEYVPTSRRLRAWVRVDRVLQLAACDPVASIRATAPGARPIPAAD